MADLTRYQAEALEYNKHIALTANAGSGKTFVLSKRFLEILINEDIPIRKIVAITFTEKAAGELRKKISQEILLGIESESNSARIGKLLKIRRELVSANISTIHSFCVDILKEFSPEVGLEANFVPVDQNTSDELLELAIERSFQIMISNEEKSAELKDLMRLFGSKSLLSDQLKKLIHARKKLYHIRESIYSKGSRYAADYMREKFDSEFKYIFMPWIPELIDDIRKLNNAVLASDESNSTALEINGLLAQFSVESSSSEILRLITRINEKLLTGNGTVRKKNYSLKIDETELVSEISSVEHYAAEIKYLEYNDNPDRIEEALVKYGYRILNVAAEVDAIYSKSKAERGYLDFEDILLLTRKAIKIEEVKKELKDNYKYFMIDEYQDTNEIQYEIFMPLLEELKSGNLFVVGDEKQSIYMFRDAELEIFERTKNEIKKIDRDKSILNLPHSFRLSPNVALFTNAVFKKLFQNPSGKFNEVIYEELICAREAACPGIVEFLLCDESGSITESDLVASRILKLLKSGISANAGEIAVLCRRRADFVEAEKSLFNAGIPYRVIGGKGYYRLQLIYDIYNYLSFLLNKNNDTALIGLLRAPFYSFPDSLICAVSLFEGSSFFEKFNSYVKETRNNRDTLDLLERHLLIASRTRFSDLIRKIISETGYIAVAASKNNYEQEIANIEKLLSVANELSQQSFKTLYDLSEFLQRAIKNLEDEGQADVSTEDTSVKLLTYHQAKGLEFDTVFLYKCHNQFRFDRVASKSIRLDKEYGILTKVPVNGFFKDYLNAPVGGIYNYISYRKTLAEEKRLLYVGITRAKNNLFISGSHKDYDFKKNSYLRMLFDSLDASYETDEIIIDDELEFMSLDPEERENIRQVLKLDIPVVKNLERTDYNFATGGSVTKQDSYRNRISDRQKKEIISATKVSMFMQCPVKYQLTYELGFISLLEHLKIDRSRINHKEDAENELYASGDLTGRIVHRLLEKRIERDRLDETIEELLTIESLKDPGLKSSRGDLKESIKTLITNFIDSGIHKEIQSYNDSKSEVEIYCGLGDFYIYGIIDKLIKDGDNIIVIDYKTDKVRIEESAERFRHHLPQLMFYALLARRYLKPKKIKVQLVFLHLPDTSFIKEIGEEELNNFEERVIGIVGRIRRGEFYPDISHCPDCHFATNENKCIKSINLGEKI